MALKTGDTLLNGQYRILRLLGRGGFGFVYHAHDTLLGEEVAIKELIPGLVGDEAMLKRFLIEARATMRLTHERIVRTHNIFSESGNYYIAMEYMAGGSLEAQLQGRGPLPINTAVRIAAEVCEGLSYAHREGVVHCDLKPANILFELDPQTGRIASAKVADFGIAHVSGDAMTRTWQTSASFVAGTLPYMSPEQADGVRDDPRVDVYALGAVLYRLLAGRPYLDFDQRETPGAQADNVYRIRNQKPQPPGACNRQIPAWLDAVAERALAKRPGDRYASTSDFRRALLQKRTVTPAAPPPRSRPAAAPAKPQRTSLPLWLWALAGGAAALLVILAILMVVVLGGGDNGEGTEQTHLTSPSPPAPTTDTAIEPTGMPQPTATAGPPPTADILPSEMPLPTDTAVAPPTPLPTATPEPTSTPDAAASSPTDTPPSPPPTEPPTKPPPTEAPPQPKPEVVFSDNFKGSSLDGSKWGVDPGEGEVIVGNGAVRMRSSGRRFPYIYSKANPFPAQADFRLTYRFHYVWVKDCGVGVIMTSYLVPAGLPQAEAAAQQQQAENNGVQAGVWQDSGSGLQLWFRSRADRADIPISNADTKWHETVIEYSGSRYTLYLDGAPVYTSLETPHRPGYIWMGHPADLGSNCWWSTLEVDHIKVERLP